MDIAAYDSTVCKECKELCDYYLDEFWNCQGESEPCPDFFNRKEFFNRSKTTTVRSCLGCPMHDELEECYADDPGEHCDEVAQEMEDYCTGYEESYDPEDGSM